MKISFRQGIIRYQRDPSGLATFLKASDGGSSLDFIAANDPLIVTFAYRKANYLHEESRTVARAWTGFKSNVDYWLFLDLDMITAQRTFGWTTVEPTYGNVAPTSPKINHHWFDVVDTTMKVWTGTGWAEKTRVFVAAYAQGAIIQPITYGSQVGVNTSNDAGFIIYDADGFPVRQHHKRKSFEYLTTASVFNTVTAKAINISLDAICTAVRATEPIPAFSLVTYDSKSPETAAIKPANYNVRGEYAIGIVQEDFWTDETGIITQHGYIFNEQWNFTEVPGTVMFLGVDGEITPVVPQTGFIQRIGEVVSRQTIRLDIQQTVRYVDDASTDYDNLVPMVIDKVTGEQMLADDFGKQAITIVNNLLKDGSKLPVTALGGETKLLEQWTADFVAINKDHERRIAILEALMAEPDPDLSIEYDRDTPMSITVGGATPGTTFKGTVQDALDKILYPFGVPKFASFGIRDVPSTLEVGASIEGGMRVFNWTTSNPQNIRTRSIAITDSIAGTQLAAGLVDNGSTSIQIGLPITRTTPSQYVWTISATDTQGGPLSRQFAVSWRWSIYYGSNDIESVIGSDVLELQSTLPASPAGTYVTPAGGYKWLCYPSSFPTLTVFKDLYTGLNVAINDPIIVPVTNKYGLTQNYKCHRSYNKLGSSITIVGS